MIRAVSGDAAFIRLLERGAFRGNIHTVFRNVLNIENETGELFTLATAALGNAPNTLLVATDDFRIIRADVGTPVTVVDKALTIGDRMISLDGTAQWQCRIGGMPLTPDKLRVNAAAVRQCLKAQGIAGGFLSSADGTPFQKATAQALTEAGERLVDAFGRRNYPEASAAAARLIGLGPGLTPSGDDFLVGLMIVLRTLKVGGSSHSRMFDAFCHDIVAIARTNTNAISAITIAKAAKGEVRETVAIFLSSLCFGEGSGWEPGLHAVLNIGSSSGADIVWGIVRGLELAGMRTADGSGVALHP